MISEPHEINGQVPQSDLAQARRSRVLPEIPDLPHDRDEWTPAMIARWVDIPQRTVSHWCKTTFGKSEGKRRMNREDAQKVVNRMFSYGQRKNIAC